MIESSRSVPHSRVWPAALLAALTAPLAAGAYEARPAREPWTAVAASGAVETQAPPPAADWAAVRRGDRLVPASWVRTGHTGRVTLTRNASLLVVHPDSQLELAAEPGPGLETSVVQTSGTVLYEVDSRAERHFEVVTPYLIAGVKGTTFLVTVEEGFASVQVQQGLVEVTDPATGESRDVGPGGSVIREAGELEVVAEGRHPARPLERGTETPTADSDGWPADSGEPQVGLDLPGLGPDIGLDAGQPFDPFDDLDGRDEGGHDDDDLDGSSTSPGHPCLPGLQNCDGTSTGTGTDPGGIGGSPYSTGAETGFEPEAQATGADSLLMMMLLEEREAEHRFEHEHEAPARRARDRRQAARRDR